MGSEIVENTKSSLEQVEKIFELMNNTTSVYLFLEILRNPGITAHRLKKRLNLMGSKIYFHLNRLKESNAILELEEVEELPNQLSRAKYDLTPWCYEQLTSGVFSKPTKENLKIYTLFQLHLGVAFLQQQIKKINQLSSKEFLNYNSTSLDLMPITIVNFVDKEVAKSLKEGIDRALEFCMTKYSNMSLSEIMKACNYGVVTGIVPI